MVTSRALNTEDPTTLGTTATWRPAFVHPYYKPSTSPFRLSAMLYALSESLSGYSVEPIVIFVTASRSFSRQISGQSTAAAFQILVFSPISILCYVDCGCICQSFQADSVIAPSNSRQSFFFKFFLFINFEYRPIEVFILV
jgi:hypothetical protein